MLKMAHEALLLLFNDSIVGMKLCMICTVPALPSDKWKMDGTVIIPGLPQFTRGITTADNGILENVQQCLFMRTLIDDV